MALAVLRKLLARKGLCVLSLKAFLPVMPAARKCLKKIKCPANRLAPTGV
jgi:hypothetical protein